MENQLTVKNDHKLPTIQELFEDDIIIAGKAEGLNAILNTPPPQKWIKEHPYISGYKYIPIDKVEYLLRKIFKIYQIEVRKTGMLLNSVEVTVRVHYRDPVDGEMKFHDGVGAQELQTQAKTGNLKIDMSNINRGAVSMALPIAKSMAVKDACDHFGEIFGCNLNRKDSILFQPDNSIMEKYTIERYERALSDE